MVVVHVDLQLKPGAGSALAETFRKDLIPAISTQQGFVNTSLLRSSTEADNYRIVIAFESEPLRLKWVASDLHNKTWPKIDAHVMKTSVQGFSVEA